MFEIGKLPSLDLGYQGENKVRTIDIDMTAWLEEYPGSKVALMVKRPDEDVYYPAGKMEGNALLWVIDRADRQYAGRGEAQVILKGADDIELRTRVVKTKISPSLSGTEVEAPPPHATWVGDVLDAAAQAEAAVEKMPSIGENGNWYAWDAAAGAYVDTGKPSKGKDGEDGEDGEDGYTPQKGKDYFDGDPGYTPQKGKDYFDGEDGISPVVEVTPITGGHRVTITDANGSKSFDVMNGDGGGGSGNGGENGGYYIPAVSSAGLLNWTPSKSDMPAVASADIKGPKGDAGYTPVKGKDYFDGANGTSVTVKSVSTSSADGGSNVVTFSDGKTLTVKNGSKGNPGDPGTNGYTPVKGTDYYTEADKAALVTEVSGKVKFYATANIGTTWSGSGPYTQTVAVSGMLASDTPIIDLLPSTDPDTAAAELEVWSMIYRIDTAANSITVYASEATTQAITIQILGVR